VWVHDVVNADVFTEYNAEQSSYFSAHPDALGELLKDIVSRKTEFVFVSQSQKEKAIEFLKRHILINDAKLHVIPNILWDHQFALSKKPATMNWHTIVYASAWQKGIRHVIALYEKLLVTIPDLKLTLLSPGYDYHRFQEYERELTEIFGDKITILGPVSKTKLGETIMTAAAVIAPPFEETFGSVFAESLSLGTPVIASHKSGAVKEIVGPDWIFDFTDAQKISDRLLLVISQRIRGSLDEKFRQEKNMSLWLALVLGKTPSIVTSSAPPQSEK
jgi:glycosyltransferase involved in cell wall biosynthesis